MTLTILTCKSRDTGTRWTIKGRDTRQTPAKTSLFQALGLDSAMQCTPMSDTLVCVACRVHSVLPAVYVFFYRLPDGNNESKRMQPRCCGDQFLFVCKRGCLSYSSFSVFFFFVCVCVRDKRSKTLTQRPTPGGRQFFLVAFQFRWSTFHSPELYTSKLRPGFNQSSLADSWHFLPHFLLLSLYEDWYKPPDTFTCQRKSMLPFLVFANATMTSPSLFFFWRQPSYLSLSRMAARRSVIVSETVGVFCYHSNTRSAVEAVTNTC